MAHSGTAVGKPTTRVISLPTSDAAQDADGAADQGQGGALDEELHQHVALLGAERLAHADLAGSLGDARPA